MARLVIVLAALALAACGSSTAPPARPAAAGCPSGAPPTTVRGAPLDTILRVPARNRGRRVPLVVALHFATGSGAALESNTGLTDEARKAGFDIAYPTATASNHWWTPPDLPKLRRTIALIKKAACIDRRRVYLVGWSNGGTAAVRAACVMSKKIAAVALFAAAVNAKRTCRPPRTPSVLEIHGTADPLWPYPRARAFVAAWSRKNDCGSPTTTPVGSRGTQLGWTGCNDGATLEHLRVAGARHVELFTDLRDAGIDPDETAWRFLRRFSLP
jgi:poly(3-hydroxybutyrate) depolymerase